MDYVEVDCIQSGGKEHNEILIAYLASIGFSMFEESENGVKAYIETDAFNQNELNNLMNTVLPEHIKVQFNAKQIPSFNWNSEWESNFQPVTIADKIHIRADYHPSKTDIEYELVIQPRMAFGTGHHATTSLVMETMLSTDLKGKSVLDMGCGTGILAILASKMGATDIVAVDIDINSTENTELNMVANETPNIQVVTGGAASAGDKKFDVMIANINRNIILADLPFYVGNITQGGLLITSGYYEEDLDIITGFAITNGLKFKSKTTLDKWCCALFEKV